VNKLLELHKLLRDSGLDIAGVSGSGPEDARVNQWNIEPTKEQEQQAAGLIENFNWSETPSKSEEQLKTEISMLTQEQRMKLIDRLIIELGLADPAKFEDAKEITLGIKQ